eukprot:c17729_g1_i2.p1 GENE.c17729_g1_i2~~c17729_g1_i2.p1  ORF type:complete len:193 (+),score=49.87 c17729_g1_i2:570-1148(+)
MLLAHRDIDVNIQEHSAGNTALLGACWNSRIRIVKLLLGHQNINVNVCDKLGRAALMKACVKGNAEIVDLLLSHKSTLVNMKDGKNRTALMHAARYDHSHTITQLLSRPEIDTSVIGKDGLSARDLALKWSSTEIVEELDRRVYRIRVRAFLMGGLARATNKSVVKHLPLDIVGLIVHHVMASSLSSGISDI